MADHGTRLFFYLHTRLPLDAALDRRDEVIAALEPLGIRLSMTVSGDTVYLADRGVPVIGDLTGGEEEPGGGVE